MNHQSEAKASSAGARKRDAFPKIEGVDEQVWKDFLENRRLKRLPNTATAHKRLMNDIERLEDAEWPAARLVEHAAAKGWGAIYDPREIATDQHDRRADGFTKALREIAGVEMGATERAARELAAELGIGVDAAPRPSSPQAAGPHRFGRISRSDEMDIAFANLMESRGDQRD